MKALVNHKEMAEQLRAQADQLQERNDAKYIKAKEEGDPHKAFDDEYWDNEKQLENLARQIHFH